MKFTQSLALAAICLSSQALASDDLRIDMETCEPAGVLSRASAAMRPLEFWVGEHVTLEILIEEKDVAHDREMCRILANRDREALQECLQYNKGYWQRIHRCEAITKQRCRSLGGRC